MIFVSKGYFKSGNCLREARCALKREKPLALMHDGDRAQMSLADIKRDECPQEMRGPIFDGRDVIEWHRIKDFQLVSLKLLAEQLLLGCPHLVKQHSRRILISQEEAAPAAAAPHTATTTTTTGGAQKKAAGPAKLSLPVSVPGELSESVWHFRTPLTTYASPSNPGALEALTGMRDRLSRNNRAHAARLRAEPSRPFEVTAEAPPPLRGSSEAQAPPAQAARLFVLYLSQETFVGDAGAALADEVRRARAADFPLVMLHSTPDNPDGCEFARLFSTTPHDLIQDGLYKALALACHLHGPFAVVSCCLLAREMGGVRASAVGDVARQVEHGLKATGELALKPAKSAAALALNRTRSSGHGIGAIRDTAQFDLQVSFDEASPGARGASDTRQF